PDTVTYSDAAPLDGQYTYRVRAVNNIAASIYTDTAQANTLRPFSPSSFTATTVSATQVDLSWSENANNELYYEIARCTGVDCTDFTRIDSLPPNTANYQDQTLEAEQTYRWRIRAWNIAGRSDDIT